MIVSIDKDIIKAVEDVERVYKLKRFYEDLLRLAVSLEGQDSTDTVLGAVEAEYYRFDNTPLEVSACDSLDIFTGHYAGELAKCHERLCISVADDKLLYQIEYELAIANALCNVALDSLNAVLAIDVGEKNVNFVDEVGGHLLYCYTVSGKVFEVFLSDVDFTQKRNQLTA